MIPYRRLVTLFTLVCFLIISGLATDASAKRREPVDPDAPTEQEAKVLGWGPVKTPNRGVRPEFLIRGVVMNIEKSKEDKNAYVVSILPIEVLNNLQRHITMAQFENGVNITLVIQKPRLKELKKGHMVEFNQYYTEEVEQSIGGAKMVAMSLHQDIQGYPTGPGAYLKKAGFYPVQYKNAIKGVNLDGGSVGNDKTIQALLDFLATKAEDAELKTIAKSTLLEFFNAEPSGKCSLDQTQQLYVCR